MSKDELLGQRYGKFRALGKFIEANSFEEIYNELPKRNE